MSTLSQYHEELLKTCVVAIEGYNENKQRTFGTGFFVAPGQILTCGHVVFGCVDCPSETGVFWRGQRLPVKDVTCTGKREEDYPDLALILVEVPTHPCACMDHAVEINDEVWSYGYPRDYRQGDAALLINEGITNDEEPMLRLRSSQVKAGSSGAPGVNIRTKRVCGIINTTLGEDGPNGGRALPVDVAFSSFPMLRYAHDTYHKICPSWGSQVDLRDPASQVTNRMLPYLIDRKPQNAFLARVLTIHAEGDANVPLICFFHGGPEDCVAEYQKCLEEEYLSDLLKLPEGYAVHFKIVDWPIILHPGGSMADACNDFLFALGKGIYDEIRILGADVDRIVSPGSFKEKVSREISAYQEPLAIGFHLHPTDLSRSSETIRWFLDFWSGILSNPYHVCLVCVFVEHPREPTNIALKVLHKLRPIRSREILVNKPELLAPAHVLPELDSIDALHVVEWINRYASRIEQYWTPAITLRGELESLFASAETRLSMRRFTKYTSDLLHIPHSPVR
jgi:hypothetical protein